MAAALPLMTLENVRAEAKALNGLSGVQLLRRLLEVRLPLLSAGSGKFFAMVDDYYLGKFGGQCDSEFICESRCLEFDAHGMPESGFLFKFHPAADGEDKFVIQTQKNGKFLAIGGDMNFLCADCDTMETATKFKLEPINLGV